MNLPSRNFSCPSLTGCLSFQSLVFFEVCPRDTDTKIGYSALVNPFQPSQSNLTTKNCRNVAPVKWLYLSGNIRRKPIWSASSQSQPLLSGLDYEISELRDRPSNLLSNINALTRNRSQCVKVFVLLNKYNHYHFFYYAIKIKHLFLS